MILFLIGLQTPLTESAQAKTVVKPATIQDIQKKKPIAKVVKPASLQEIQAQTAKREAEQEKQRKIDAQKQAEKLKKEQKQKDIEYQKWAEQKAKELDKAIKESKKGTKNNKDEVKVLEHIQPIINKPINTTDWSQLSKKRQWLKNHAEKFIGMTYSQKDRMSDFATDCSSFVHRALINTKLAEPTSWAFTTYTMNQTGLFEQIPFSELKAGDLVWGDGHVAFYWGDDKDGNKISLESTPIFGVNYGYINANGWDFKYLKALRIKGIDS